MSFHLSRKAKADLKVIAKYTEKAWGRAQRNTYLEKIDRSFHDLANRPDKGQNCDGVRQGYRKYRIGKHIIYYRMTEPKHIEIVRVLHGSMDIERHLNE